MRSSKEMLVKKLDLGIQSKNNANLSQIRPVGVTDKKIINALKIVDRAEFVPNYSICLAYSDAYIECEPGRTMFSLQAIASILQFLKPTKNLKTMLIGGNYGYLAAVLSTLGVKPYIVESSPTLFAKCHEKLKKYAIANICSNQLNVGMLSDAPFDLIIMEVGSNYVPKAIQNQLSDGGKIVASIYGESNEINIYAKLNGALLLEYSFAANMNLSSEMTESEIFDF